jgi:hypothetical protein
VSLKIAGRMLTRNRKVVGLHYFHGQWCRKHNHDAVHVYMGRLSR